MADNFSPEPLHLTPRNRLVLVVALLLAMTLPTLVTWLYFLVLVTDKNSQNVAQQTVYFAGKIVQLLLPITVFWLLHKRVPRLQLPRFDGIVQGAAFGLLVAGAMFLLYYAWLIDSPLLASTPQRVQEKVTQLGFSSPGKYFLLGVGYTLVHSLFEEYYYRWFIFGYLRKLLPFAPAVIVSSLAFMGHHVILLNAFLPQYFLVAALPLSLCIAVGGACWAWLYERTGTIYSAWVSHGIVDAAIFGLGWILLMRSTA
jgi:membrane protease YdiL (CAAX protease family)